MKKIGRKIYKLMFSDNNISKLEVVLIILILLTGLLTMCYGDLKSTIDNSILLLKATWHGEFFHFYDYSALHKQTVWAANYEILIFIVFAIWNIPVAICNHFFNYDYLNGMGSLLWNKILLVGCVVYIIYIIYKMCIYVGVSHEKSRMAQILFLSSINVFLPTFMLSQYDIITLCFMISGVYMFLQKKEKLFIICFAFAIPMKIFALFIFIPLVLLEEKKVLKAILKLLYGISVLVLCKIISWPSRSYHFLVPSFSKLMINRMQNSGIYTGLGVFSFFIAAFVTLCIYCYSKKVNDEERNKYGIYISCFSMVIFFLTFPWYPYWLVLTVPFIMMVVITNDRYLKLNILLETLFGLLSFVIGAIQYAHVYASSCFENMLFDRVLHMNYDHGRYYNVAMLLNRYGITQYKGALYTIFIVAGISLLVLNRPGAVNRFGKNEEKIEHSLIYLRIFSMFLVMMIIFATAFYKRDSLMTGLSTENKVETDFNILVEGNTVEQEIVATKDTTIDEIDFWLNNQTNYSNTSILVVYIIEKESGKILGKNEIGTSLITDEPVYMSFNVDIKKDKEYIIKIVEEQEYEGVVNPIITEGYVDYLHPAKFNGQEMQGNLYMQVFVK